MLDLSCPEKLKKTQHLLTSLEPTIQQLIKYIKPFELQMEGLKYFGDYEETKVIYLEPSEDKNLDKIKEMNSFII